MSTCDAIPTNSLMFAGGMNEATKVLRPLLVLHANVAFSCPWMPQSFQDRLMPDADAVDAERTARIPAASNALLMEASKLVESKGCDPRQRDRSRQPSRPAPSIIGLTFSSCNGNREVSGGP